MAPVDNNVAVNTYVSGLVDSVPRIAAETATVAVVLLRVIEAPFGILGGREPT